MGGNHPVRIQSMTSVPTMDTQLTVEQVMRMITAGCEYVRITTRNVREAENLLSIKRELKNNGCDVPLIADVHFNPSVAEMAARIVEKVRINPGNYLPEETGLLHASEAEIKDCIRNRLLPLIRICKENGTALRIGSNHGSLSGRIVARYGDTPLGMVESALEFARICREENFNELVISMKSSNTRVMIYSNRLLVQRMKEEGMNYPIHLGVTEAGDGEDGRIKSAVGIGTLLREGIGDTIRVSLTEEPELEIPVARMILQVSCQELCPAKRSEAGSAVPPRRDLRFAPISSLIEYSRRKTLQVGEVGGTRVPIVATAEPIPGNIFTARPGKLTEELISKLKNDPSAVLVAESDVDSGHSAHRALFKQLNEIQCLTPVIIKVHYPRMDSQELLIRSSIDFGSYLIDGLGDGIWIDAEGQSRDFINPLSYGILQGSRCRFSKTEFIACPSCGRTLFNIQDTLHRIKERMGHLQNLKIAVMGCIVNGPGEMADADYGYVGAGFGKVTLYKGNTIVRKNVDEKDALGALEDLIRSNGDWQG
ncbi:MAG: (E)-4-hydroxy-3-methylbut-2-enyl-diphosphate synthase [Lentimicrobiaceae bacterium]|nr:(E)-4-hydroxy-3-methylbut-2-enyl-diphosphate synthase [Lentimicrobiaceae bacterium]